MIPLVRHPSPPRPSAGRRTAATVLVVATVVAATTACSQRPEEALRRVHGSTTTTPGGAPAQSTTVATKASPETTGGSTTTTAPPPAPVPTQPLTTAPPSQLLTEVTAAYDAAYADLLAAEAVPDPNFPGLAEHITGAQLTKVRSVINAALIDGIKARQRPEDAWRRIEAIDVQPDAVQLTVCSFDATDSVRASGEVVSLASRPFRYLETMVHEGGVWKWTAREWIDPSHESSDCALPGS